MTTRDRIMISTRPVMHYVRVGSAEVVSPCLKSHVNIQRPSRRYLRITKWSEVRWVIFQNPDTTRGASSHFCAWNGTEIWFRLPTTSMQTLRDKIWLLTKPCVLCFADTYPGRLKIGSLGRPLLLVWCTARSNFPPGRSGVWDRIWQFQAMADSRSRRLCFLGIVGFQQGLGVVVELRNVIAAWDEIPIPYS